MIVEPEAEPAPAPVLPGENALLVAAHPGHELRVYGWLEMAQPTVFVLTDGSGAAGEGRVGSTSRVLERAGARTGEIYGCTSDRGIYTAILNREVDFFRRTADTLAETLVRGGIDYVVADAVEGYNPSHDATRLMVNAAVEMVRRTSGILVPNYDFLLDGAPGACPEDRRDRAVWLRLDEAALRRKVDAATGYPELAGEVERALSRFGAVPFGVECLRPVDAGLSYELDDPPYYETYGEQRVAAGAYQRVLRYREHFLPLVNALREHVDKSA